MRPHLTSYLTRVGTYFFVAGLSLNCLADDSSLPEAELRKWRSISSGAHSLRTLGDAFYVDVPMRPIPGAKLAFFNYELARRLGLKIPSDPKELERIMTEFFAVEKDPTGQSTLKMMATRYLDSGRKGPGEAMGDGRAVWTGELAIPTPDGKVVSVDFTSKGIGATPLAWTKNDAAHSDGRLKMKELVRSAITSKANVKNELDSTDDLMGFVIPEEGGASRGITIRAGNQTRTSHYRYFQDEPENFKKIVTYIVRRDLGLPAGQAIGPQEVTAYFKMFVANMADETARYADLEAIHGSPTGGNRTTRGSTIDLMEFWYHDAYHSNFRYLFDRVQLVDQVESMGDYAKDILAYLRYAKYPVPAGITAEVLTDEFNRIFTAKLTEHWLNRMGLSASEIKSLSPQLKKDFFTAVGALRSAFGTEKKKIFWNNIIPAAFDMRSIFSRTFALWGTPESDSVLFQNQRSWATAANPAHEKLKRAYLDSVGSIIQSLGDNGQPRPAWVKNAKFVNGNTRLGVGDGMPASPGDPFFHAHDEKILKELENADFDYRKVTAMIDSAAGALADPGLKVRGVTSLGMSPGSIVRRTASAPECSLIFKSVF